MPIKYCLTVKIKFRRKITKKYHLKSLGLLIIWSQLIKMSSSILSISMQS